MININAVNARNWARLGPRGTFGITLLSLAPEIENLLALSADLCNTSGLDRFRAAYPDRFFNAGIAEQNMLGMAAGLAKEGSRVFCTTFATFAAMRACEMVRLHMGYMGLDIKLVGLGAGFSMGMFGNTHYAVEDMAIMRAVPGLRVLSPADCASVAKATEAAARCDGPVYLRLTGVAGNPVVYSEEFDFEIGRAISVRQGRDIAIIATGSMVYESIVAARLLDARGIAASVIDMHTIKPLDTAAIDSVMNTKLMVTVEEHSVIGGLGGAVAEYKSRVRHAPEQLFLGVDDRFSKAGSYKYMLQRHGLTGAKIADSIVRRMDNARSSNSERTPWVDRAAA